MLPSLAELRRDVETAARRLLVIFFGVLACLVGLGFLTEMLWRYIALEDGAFSASLFIGVAYLAVGTGVIWLWRKQRKPTDTHRHNESDVPLFEIAEGFAAGMRAGRAARANDTR